MSSTATAAPVQSKRRETAKDKAARARTIRDREARATAARNKPDDLVDFELPEVEIVRKELEKVIVGLTVEQAEATSMKCLRSYYFRNYFTKRVIGLKITSVKRIGLYITIGLSNDTILIMSLGASGSPRRSQDTTEPPDNTEVAFSFDDGSQLFFVDPVGTGQLFLVPVDGLETQLPDTARYGHDPLTPVAWIKMGRWLLQQDDELKSVITNDEFLVGIGEIYADEILFEAGLRHDRLALGLTGQEIRRLHRALVSTMFDALKYGGTSVLSRPFVSPSGSPGLYASHLKVWGLHGKLSARSRTPIRREMYRNTWTYYCDTQV